MDERYPIGVTSSCAVTVLRQDGADSGYGGWAVAIGLLGGEATVRVPGHYAGVLADSLRSADVRFAPGTRLGRDEYLDVTGLVVDGLEMVALSSTARSPVRVTVEVPRGELGDLAELLARAQELIETLRQGLGLVPDSLPEAL
ncbi:MAG: hypothetical protein QOG85_1872 [Gaiellaceae bacterium]|jgi:hypothetical protein|nr:hypothetical protein [Gaiellaceae bacterium]